MNLSNFNYMLYSVTREEVVKGKLEGVKKFIFQLNKKKRDGYQNACIFIDGYEDTKDELYEIKEVRQFIEKMVTHFPHVLYFLNRDLEAHVYVLACLSDVTTTYTGTEKVTAYEEFLTQKPQTQIRIQMKLKDEWYTKMIKGLIEFNQIVKDDEGIHETIQLIERFH